MRRRPNILLILADDMGYGDFGCFNRGLSQTPALDALVEEGTCLTQHYSASPVCAPARAALLTGRYPHRTGAVDTLELRGLDRIRLGERTIGDYLAAAGYVTGLVGKWHNGALDPRYHPNRRGFAEFAGFSGGWQPYFEWHHDRNGAVGKADGRYYTDVLTDEAIEFLHRHRREPFFLYLAYNAPHYPFHARDEDLACFRDGGHTLAVSHVYGMIRRLDHGVGRVLEALDREGLADDTLVMFSSDNGPQFGGHGDMCTDRFNCGFAGAKLSVYEGGIRLPMVLRWPAGLDGRRRLDGFVHFTDWLPTLLALAEAPPPAAEVELDGADVLPLLRGEPPSREPRRFWQWNRYTPAVECNAAMRDGRWKLVRPAIGALMTVTPEDFAKDVDAKLHPEKYTEIELEPEPARSALEIPPPAIPPPQLFDLQTDPTESHDLAAVEPARVARMERALETWFEEVMG